MKKSEEQITILQADHFDSLPKETQSLISELTNELNIKEINKFNPIVEAMVVLEGFTLIKYEEDNLETIEQYKEAKKLIGSFNSSTKRAKGEIKAPILARGRKLDAIEKIFLNRAKEIMDIINKEFDPYLQEKELKKKEVEERKNKEILDKVESLNESNQEQQLIINRSKVFKSYVDYNQAILNSVIEKVDTYSQIALIQLKTKINSLEIVFTDEDNELLLQDQVENISTSHDSIKTTCIRMINMRINEIEQEALLARQKKEQELADAKAIEEPQVIVATPLVSTPAPQHMHNQTFSDYFERIMNEAISKIESLVPVNDKEKQAQSSAIGGLQGYTIKIINYLENE